MLESIKEFWYLWLIVVLLIVIIIPVCIKVSKSVQKRSEANEKLKKDFERIKMLKEKYKDLDLEKVQNADAKELCEGLTAVIQYKLEKSENPDAEFENTEKWKREVYALFYFDEDVTADSLSFFFRSNGGPLPKEAIDGITSIGYEKIQSVSSQMSAMCDDKNETVSFDKNRIAELDEKFKNVYDRDLFFELVKKYIVGSIGKQ